MDPFTVGNLTNMLSTELKEYIDEKVKALQASQTESFENFSVQQESEKIFLSDEISKIRTFLSDEITKVDRVAHRALNVACRVENSCVERGKYLEERIDGLKKPRSLIKGEKYKVFTMSAAGLLSNGLDAMFVGTREDFSLERHFAPGEYVFLNLLGASLFTLNEEQIYSIIPLNELRAESLQDEVDKILRDEDDYDYED